MARLYKETTPISATGFEDALGLLGVPGFPLQGLTSPFSDLGVTGSTTHGFHVMSNNPIAPIGATAFSVGVFRLCPFWVPRTIHIDQIGFVITVVGGAGAKARMGIYNADVNPPFLPTSLIVDGGEFDATVLNAKITSVDVTLAGSKMYWGCYVPGTSAPTIAAIANSFSHPYLGYQISAAATTVVGAMGLALTQAYGALPGNLIQPTGITAYALGGNIPALFYRHN